MDLALKKSRAKFMSKVMFHMSFGFFVTFALALLFAYFKSLLTIPLLVLSNKWTFKGFILFQIFLAVTLPFKIYKISLRAAYTTFYLYAMLNSITFTVIFIFFELPSIIFIFLTISILFFTMGIIGAAIKHDLSGFGGFLLMLFLGLILATAVNLVFLKPLQVNFNTFIVNLDFILSVIGVVVFSALTIFNMNRLKRLHLVFYYGNSEKFSSVESNTYSSSQNSGETFLNDRYSILGALTLYLGYINIFFSWIKLLDKSKSLQSKKSKSVAG